jgi:hypothetical protein
MDKSFFGSFFSKKELLACLLPHSRSDGIIESAGERGFPSAATQQCLIRRGAGLNVPR